MSTGSDDQDGRPQYPKEVLLVAGGRHPLLLLGAATRMTALAAFDWSLTHWKPEVELRVCWPGSRAPVPQFLL